MWQGRFSNFLPNKRPPSNNNLIPELAVQAPASPKKKGGVKIGFGEDKVKEIEAREPEEKV